MANSLAGSTKYIKNDLLCYLKSFSIHHIEIYSELKHQYANGFETDRRTDGKGERKTSRNYERDERILYLKWENSALWFEIGKCLWGSKN